MSVGRARPWPRRGRPAGRLPASRGRGGTGARRGDRRLRLARIDPRRRRLALAVIVAAGLVLFGGWTLFKDSSLVAVQRVSVTGQSGPNAGAISSALTSAARGMTTLDVSPARLRTAVSSYPEVKELRVSAQFPHGLRIQVIEQLAVAAVQIGGRRVAVAGDGTLLHAAASASLPLIPLAVPPGGPRLTERAGVAAVAALAAAPYQLLARISQVTTTSDHGLVAQIRGGPAIYLGDPSQLRAKWISASEVLADSGSAGALYIDVTDPSRPAAGAGTGPPTTTTGTASTSIGGG